MTDQQITAGRGLAKGCRLQVGRAPIR